MLAFTRSSGEMVMKVDQLSTLLWGCREMGEKHEAKGRLEGFDEHCTKRLDIFTAFAPSFERQTAAMLTCVFYDERCKHAREETVFPFDFHFQAA